MMNWNPDLLWGTIVEFFLEMSEHMKTGSSRNGYKNRQLC